MRQTFFTVIEVLQKINILTIKILFILEVVLCVLHIFLPLMTDRFQEEITEIISFLDRMILDVVVIISYY